MFPKYWHYVAPHRIRGGDLALPKCESWDEILDLNLQRFARTLEFQGCVAFVGSGASCALGYPEWKDLLPKATKLDQKRAAEYERLRELIKTEHPIIGYPEAIEIAQGLLTNDRESGRDVIVTDLLGRFDEKVRRKVLEQSQKHDPPPLPGLLELPIRRFITTNYDGELEEALKSRLGADYDGSKSFAQNELKKLAIFTVALAPSNRNMVFHCHGALHTDVPQLHTLEHSKTARPTLVLTDEDYKYWYLSDNRVAFTFQRCLEVLLQSNPLFFVGYSLNDSDLVRILRHLSISHVPRRVASNAFALIRRDADETKLWCRAQQIKFGINLIPYKPTTSLADELVAQQLYYQEIRAAWRCQPRAKRPSTETVMVVQPRPGKDLLFKKQLLDADEFLHKIHEAFGKSPVVALLGPAGAAKYVKVCQFVRSKYAGEFQKLVFSSHGNEDIYSYLKRIVEVLASSVKGATEAFETTLVQRLENLLDSRPEDTTNKLLLVISGIDLFLDFDEAYNAQGDESAPQNDALPEDTVQAKGKAGAEHDHAEDRQANRPEHFTWRGGKRSSVDDRPQAGWAPRNTLADQLMTRLARWSDKNGTGNRMLLTSRSIPHEENWKGKIECIRLRRDSQGQDPFSREQLDLEPDEYGKLTWQLQDQHYALIIAAAYVVDFVGPEADRERRSVWAKSPRELRMNELLHILSANSFERGTRVVRHIVRALDRGVGRKHELLLTYLSCFNTPIAKGVINACMEVPTFKEQCSMTEFEGVVKDLIKFRLLYRLGPRLTEGGGSDEEDNYVVPDIVKRYCRTILAGSKHPEKRACGVHGLLSRGPFNDPGKPERVRELFDSFAKLAFEEIRRVMEGARGEEVSERASRARLFTRAALDILRSNFACNSVPQWGSYIEYVEMCSFCLDLVKNLAWTMGKDVWSPGEKNHPDEKNHLSEKVSNIFSRQNYGTASPEEMIFLYNELGLAYYNEGAIQDALSVWGLAFEWQKAVAMIGPEQGVMYSASLNSHLGMANMQMGRMDTAKDCIEKARAAAHSIRNDDLSVRMRGILARIDHFRGSIDDAGRVYKEIADELGDMGNHRAQSYFMRHRASLLIRLGQFEEAEQTVRSSMAIAASENCTDMVAFCGELLAKIYNHGDRPRDAIREYRITLTQARKLGISRLQADALLGLAKVQLGLGDATAARAHAIDALKLANEHLLVLRQIKALVIIGQAAAQLGDIEVGVSCLQHASRLASDSEFRLAEHDADEALAELRVGGEASGRSSFRS